MILQFCSSVNSLVFKIVHYVLSFSVLFAQYVATVLQRLYLYGVISSKEVFPTKVNDYSIDKLCEVCLLSIFDVLKHDR